jgi:sodium transport system ATP-binding protein
MDQMTDCIDDLTAAEVRVEVEALAKTYPGHDGEDVHAVRGVDFRCHSGEIFGLLGLNGAGKTTTLRMLATSLTPTRGSARVAGHDIVSDSRKVRQNIGFLSASTGLYHRLTAAEMVRTFGELHGLVGSDLDDRVRRTLETFGIDRYADMRCEKLSTGMKQKVGIARCVVHDPPVLILDEPTSGLDVLAAATTLEFVEQLREQGRCVLFSTHIMSEVERLCDRVAILHDGRIRAVGTPDELREEFEERYLEKVFLRAVSEGQ